MEHGTSDAGGDEEPDSDEEYCSACGTIVERAAATCPACGADREGGTGMAGRGGGEDGADADVRDDWWHVIAFMPAAFVIAGAFGGAIAGLLLAPMMVLYPVAFYKDGAYVRALGGDWRPRRSYWVLGGIAGSLTLGIGSFLVSPFYLWKRHTGLG